MRYPIEFKYRFEVLIPLTDNQGRAFPLSKIERVGDDFVEQFNGCRCQPAPYHGLWKHRGNIQQEKLLVFTADTPRSDDSLDWIAAYKRRLQRDFKQVEIYLAVTELMWL